MLLLIYRILRIFGPAVIVTAVPILVAHYVLHYHALSISQKETRAVAERYIERAETIIAEGITTLRTIRAEGHISCRMTDRQAYGRYAFASHTIQQIGVVDSKGNLLCGEPMGSLTAPVRLPVAEPGDPSVMIGILTDGDKDRQAVVTLRAGDERRLVARFHRIGIDIAAGSALLQNSMELAIYLDDGSLWYELESGWRAQSEPGAISETIASTRFPLKARVSSSSKGASASVSGLYLVVVIFSTLSGFITYAISLLAVWRNNNSDAFMRAIKKRAFVPYYQPIFDLTTDSLYGAEVLIRWQRSDGSVVAPSQFIPYALATGLIRDITRQIMEKTVEDCAAFYAAHPDLKLSVNLSAMHFNDVETLQDIQQIYGESGISYKQLCFEVTEQYPLKDLALSRTIIGWIQALGCTIALDDVSTGQGGLAYLKKLGVDIIKIDKMFIDDIGRDHSSQAIADTLIELGNQLGVKIIAEGVEREEQVKYLKTKGVQAAQGYFFSPPLSREGFIDFMTAALDKKSITISEEKEKGVEKENEKVSASAA